MDKLDRLASILYSLDGINVGPSPAQLGPATKRRDDCSGGNSDMTGPGTDTTGYRKDSMLGGDTERSADHCNPTSIHIF